MERFGLLGKRGGWKGKEGPEGRGNFHWGVIRTPQPPALVPEPRKWSTWDFLSALIVN